MMGFRLIIWWEEILCRIKINKRIWLSTWERLMHPKRSLMNLNDQLLVKINYYKLMIWIHSWSWTSSLINKQHQKKAVSLKIKNHMLKYRKTKEWSTENLIKVWFVQDAISWKIKINFWISIHRQPPKLDMRYN